MIFEPREKIFRNLRQRRRFHRAKLDFTAQRAISPAEGGFHCNKDRQIFVATSQAPQITLLRLPTFCASPMT